MNLERLLIVLAVIAVAVAVAKIQNRGVAVVKRRRSFVGIAPGVVVFESSSCGRCEAVESVVSSIAGEGGYSVVRWDDHPDVFRDNGIDRIPAIARIGEDGTGWLVSGIPSARRLRGWLGNP